MKKLTVTVLAVATLMSASVFAAQIALPSGPLFFEGLTAEQFSKTNDINNAANPARAGTTEGNWGIVEITTISVGTALLPTGSQIAGPGAPLFTNGQLGGEQILGIFYGVLNNPGGPPDTSTGGILDLYFWKSNTQSLNTLGNTDLSKRGTGGSQSGTAQSQYLGFTCPPNTLGCTLLARFDFTSGADVNSQVNTIFAPAGSSTFESYLSVDTTAVGAWTGFFNTNFFTLNPNNQTCSAAGVSCTSPNDMRTDGNVALNGVWDVMGTDITGLGKNISVRAYVVPEPDSLVLLSVGLAVAGAIRVHRRAKAQPKKIKGARVELNA